jgi:hypothetical protein
MFWLSKNIVILVILSPLFISAKEMQAGNGLLFKENKGQVTDQHYKPRNDIRFYGSDKGLSYFLKDGGISYQLYKKNRSPGVPLLSQPKEEKADSITIYRLDVEWIGADKSASIQTRNEQGGFENYYISDHPVLNVKSYGSVLYKDIYPLVDLKYYSSNGSLKYDYIVKPGSNYKNIRLKIEGATSINPNMDGSVTITTPLGNIIEGSPKVYQDGKELRAGWVVNNGVLGFEIDGYDVSKEMVIDPLVRTWATYYGGGSWGGTSFNGWDEGNGTGTDINGNVYICGSTSSNTNIATSGTFQTNIGTSAANSATVAFLAKFNSSGSRLWGTYYGYGNGIGPTLTPGQVIGLDCASDAMGNVYLTGYAGYCTICASTNGYQTGPQNGAAFLAKFDSNGQRLWGTYYGGPTTVAENCAVDANNNVYISGVTSSATNISSSSGQQNSLGGAKDGFLAKFNSAGARLWATYYGGTGNDSIRGLVAINGAVIISGTTWSSNNIATISGFQPNLLGSGPNAFLAKIDSNGQRDWGTYFGQAETWGNGCEAEQNGSLYIVGKTNAGGLATPGVSQQTSGGMLDGFLAKFDNNGSRVWTTYLGGISNDLLNGCAVDNSGGGKIFVYGQAYSSDNIVTPGAYRIKFPANATAASVFAEFDSLGQKKWATYYGFYSMRYNGCSASNGAVYFLGTSPTYETSTPGSHQPIPGGNPDAYLVKFSDCAAPSMPVINTPSPIVICAYDSVILSTPSMAGIHYQWYKNDDTLTGAQANNYTARESGRYLVAATDNIGCPSFSPAIELISNPVPVVLINKTEIPCSGNPLATIKLIPNNLFPPYTFSWNGLPDTTAVVSNLPVGTYVATTTDSNGCFNSDSITITQSTSPMPSSPLASICAVTVDSATGKDIVIWEKNGIRHASLYKIYRETQVADQYVLAGSLLSGQFSTFLDTASRPQQQSHRYKISEMDSCNNEFPMSEFHKTIHLTSNKGLNSEINLIWNTYEGKSYNTHYIMRKVNNGLFINIAQVSSNATSFTDVNPPFGIKKYRVDIDLPAACNPSAKSTAFNTISSNVISDFTGPVVLVPNPTPGPVEILGETPARVIVINAVGQVVSEFESTNVINIGQLNRGIYLVNLYDQTGNLYYREKMVKW